MIIKKWKDIIIKDEKCEFCITVDNNNNIQSGHLKTNEASFRFYPPDIEFLLKAVKEITKYMEEK